MDFENNTICIERTVVQRKTLVDKPRTKNKKSYRTLPLVVPVKEMLLSLKSEQEEQRIIFGDSYCETDRVCRMKDGTPLKPDYITRQFGLILDRNSDKIKRIRLHDLRHTTASLLLKEGHSLEEIQAYLGHESIISTELYAHLQAKNKLQTAASMERVIGI